MYSMERVHSDYKNLVSDLRTFGLQNLRNEETFISNLRKFGLQNLRTREQSPVFDLRLFLLSVHSKACPRINYNLTRFNNIAIHGTHQMAVDNEARAYR